MSDTPVDAYLAGFSGEARAALDELRALLREAVPGASETMSYGIPTLDLHGRHVLHFAGFARHVGLYPTPSGMTAFDAELTRYARAKGSVRFPLGEPLPAELICRIAAFRVAEVEAESAVRRRPARSAAERTTAPTPGAAAARSSVDRPPRRARHPMPDDVRAALAAEGLSATYEARPPYQRNDYLGWIAAAKREATRAKRLRQMLDELADRRTYMGMTWKARGGGG
jgi:uncharacterized protein YdhG (YjbR/CyaY superfamily)